MGQGAHPENWGSYVCNQWMKLIHDQKLAKFLVCRAVLAKIYDSVDIKLQYHFWPEMGVMPHMWAKHPPMGQNAHLAPGILPRHDDENVELLLMNKPNSFQTLAWLILHNSMT